MVTMGDRGRLVIPAELRERAGLDEGSALLLLEAADGVVLLSPGAAEAPCPGRPRRR